MLGLVPVKQFDRRSHPAGARRPWYRDAMFWVRRIHLYSGLFMFPWVMLYGVTALLFNHPGAFPDQARRTLRLTDFADTVLSEAAVPAADAQQVVAALNAKTAAGGSSPLRLVRPDEARYLRDQIAARVRGDGQEHAVLYDIPSGTASLSSSRQAEDDKAPFAVRGLKVPGSLAERLKSGLPQAVKRQGLSGEEAGIAVGSDLVFIAEADGCQWKVKYNIQTGAVTGSPAMSSSNLSPRAFLTQLHLAHGYPSSGVLRWAWAMGVDAMFVSMVFWGLSGVLMWWQLKAVRWSGAMLFAVGLLTATILAALMYGLLAT